MRTVDVLRLAVKSLRGARWWLPAGFFAVAAFCGTVALAIDRQVRAEQALPCELTMSVPSGAISEAALEKARQVPGVLGASAILELPATVTGGVYSANLTLTGIDAGYLPGAFLEGGMFPDTSAMPYIVLNGAACKQFVQRSDEDDEQLQTDSGEASGEAPSLDWLNTGFAVNAGPRPVAAKVCGILPSAQPDGPPAAYASLPSVKALLRAAGQKTTVRTAKVRVVNIGWAHAVSQALAALGLLSADDNAAQQARWDGLYGQMRYLLALAALALLCAIALLRQGARLAALREVSAWAALETMGAKPGLRRRISVIQGLIVMLLGVVFGVAVALALPGFLPDNMAESVFAIYLSSLRI